LLIFDRKQPFSVFFDPLGAGGDQAYLITFLGASLSGLFLFYGFEACGSVAEEVNDPTRRIPKAMIMTILIGGVSRLMSYAGYVLAAPDLPAIMDGSEPDPIPAILEDALGTVGSKVFLVVAITAFISCVLSLQAATSRLLYGSARDGMLPFSNWLSGMSANHAVPTNALLVACLGPIALCLFVFWRPDSLARVAAFAVLGIYVAFQAVVLAALRQRLRGWRPAGLWNLGSAGMAVNVAALAYGIFAMFLLARPGEGDTFLDRWIVIIGAILVFITGLAYMLIAKPYDRYESVPEGDAVQVAAQLRSLREQSPAG
jgi:amino acid transporter